MEKRKGKQKGGCVFPATSSWRENPSVKPSYHPITMHYVRVAQTTATGSVYLASSYSAQQLYAKALQRRTQYEARPSRASTWCRTSNEIDACSREKGGAIGIGAGVWSLPARSVTGTTTNTLIYIVFVVRCVRSYSVSDRRSAKKQQH